MLNLGIVLIFSFMPISLPQSTHSHHHARLDVQPDSLNPLERFQASPPPPTESDSKNHHHPFNYDDEYEDYGTYETMHFEIIESSTTASSMVPAQVLEGETCKDYQWKCSDGGCVYKHFRCDFGPDCDDGSDEIDCDEDEYKKDGLIMSSASTASAWKFMICLMSVILYAIL